MSSRVTQRIDVKGYETEGLACAERNPANPELQALILELNGSRRRYGSDANAIQTGHLSFGNKLGARTTVSHYRSLCFASHDYPFFQRQRLEM